MRKNKMTHAEAVSMVRGKRNADRRKVGNNTYAEILHDGSEIGRAHV